MLSWLGVRSEAVPYQAQIIHTSEGPNPHLRIAKVLWRRKNPMATPDAWESALKTHRERDPYFLAQEFDFAEQIVNALQPQVV